MRKIPTHKKLLVACIGIGLSSALTTGCATLFSSRYQKVSFENATAGAKITYPETGVRKKGSKVKFDKNKMYQTVQVSKDGYKTTNYAFQLTKRSPTLAFGILDIAVPFYGWFYGIPIDLSAPKTHKFDKVQKVPALTVMEKRKSTEKYMLVNNTAFDAKGKDITWHDYLSINRFRNNAHNDTRTVRKHNKSKDREDLKVDNTIFTAALNGTMKDMNFVDTTHTIFPNISNSLYLNATVKKIALHTVRTRTSRHARSRVFWGPNDLLAVELQIEWDVLDYYKQTVYSTKTNAKSDLFTLPFDCNTSQFNEQLARAIKDNMETAVLGIRKELSAKGILNISSGTAKDALPAITIAKPSIIANGRMNDFMKSAVTVKVDDGHGSGVVISNDGYIVTAYHVVAGSKKIEVICNDGSKEEAEVVRKNEEADLALIKVKKQDLPSLLLSSDANPEIGVDVWAIGTPKSIELGQSVSKGILSAIRTANSINYLQTDVSINGGNSGGALVNKDGTVLGIVTSKLVGVGTEGVGFAISTQEIFDKLKISYK